MSALRPLAALALGASLCACVPNLGPRPQPLAPARYASSRSLAAPATTWPRDAWWRDYGDPQLNALETEALAGAPDLRAADARTRRALAAAEQAGAATRPDVSVNARPEATRLTRNQGYPDLIKQYLPTGVHSQGRLTLDLAFDLDFFGRNRAALAAATSEAQAAEANAAASRLYLSTAIASSYAELLRLSDDRAAAVAALRVRQDSLALVSQRFAQGLATRVDQSRQATTVPVAVGDLAAIDRQITGTRHQIAALMGAGPDLGLAIAPPARPTLHPFGVPAMLPLDLVGRRPDLVAARWRTEAAGRRIDVAKQDFYPNVNLNAFAGVQSFGIGQLFTKDALVGSAGPAISLPLFAGGRLKGAHRGARASYDEAVASYDGLLTGTLRDIADLLAGERSLRDQLDAAQQAQASAASAYDGVRQRYAAGLATHLDVLTAEEAVVTQRRAVADLRAQFFTLDIALVRALGGGFADQRVAGLR